MPTFPAKTNYAAGDILTAAQMVDVGNGLNDLLPDAKGSLTTVSAANTPAQLTVGADGSTLLADSASSTGLRWQGSMAGGRNAIINGGMDFSQRGTGALAANAYTLDRWYLNSYGTGGSNLSVQQKTDGTATGFTNYARISTNSTTVVNVNFSQSLETAEVRRFQGKPITVSFQYKVPVNWSAQWGVDVYYTTGTDVNISSPYVSGATLLVNKTLTNTTSWTSNSVTATLPSNATSLAVIFNTGGNTVNGAQFDLSQVQLELGSVPTQFCRAGGTLQGELAACKRYLPSVSGASGFVGSLLGYAYATDAATYIVPFDVQARVAPTGITVAGTNTAYALNVGTTVTPTFNTANINNGGILASHTITAGQGSRLEMGANSIILFTGCEL